MAKKLYAKIKFAWWLDYYIAVLVFMCRLFGTTPNDEKLEKVIKFAMKKPVITAKEPTKDFDA